MTQLLSKDHKPEVESEAMRIKALGGDIYKTNYND
jgi:hypothetical protein